MGLVEREVKTVESCPLDSKYLLAKVGWQMVVESLTGNKLIEAFATFVLLRLASWFGPFRQFVLAHPLGVEGLGNIHPLVVAAVGMWESLLSDFQGLWENSFIVFPSFHRPSYPAPLSVDFTTQASSCCWMTAFASCCVFYGSGRTRNLFR